MWTLEEKSNKYDLEDHSSLRQPEIHFAVFKEGGKKESLKPYREKPINQS